MKGYFTQGRQWIVSCVPSGNKFIKLIPEVGG